MCLPPIGGGSSDGRDELAPLQDRLDMRRVARQAVEVGDGDGTAAAVCLHGFDHGIERPHGDRHVARMRGDAGVARCRRRRAGG